MHVLLDDGLGGLVLRPVRPWHRMLARGLAASLDRRLAEGARPESDMILAARAMRLTTMTYRCVLAASLRRVLAAAEAPALPPRVQAARPPVCRERISRSAAELAELARCLLQPGPAPARGVAMVSQLLADGAGPLYRQASQDDLGAIAERAGQWLTR